MLRVSTRRNEVDVREFREPHEGTGSAYCQDRSYWVFQYKNDFSIRL